MTAHLSNLQPDDWDKPLPEEHKPARETWCSTLQVPRCYTDSRSKAAKRRELHTFCDASNKAIGAVSFLRTVQQDGHINISYVFGKKKLAPTHTTTVPSLELCTAVLGVEIAQLITDELDLELDTVRCYADGRVVLGYVSNKSYRFFVYVSKRDKWIRKSSTPEQWHYVPTNQHPADLASRSVDAQHLVQWPQVSSQSERIHQDECHLQSPGDGGGE